MEANPTTVPARRSRNGGAWRWLVAFALVISAIVTLTTIGIIKTASPLVSLVKALPGIASRFKTGTITSTFRESIPEVSSSHGDILELATSRSDEFFQREDSKSIFWDMVDLGTTTSEIRVPVTFRYHLRLSDPWRLATRGNVCVVMAPPIRPSLPPAIHTNLMEKKTVNGWARFNKDENLSSLEKSLTPVLIRRAGNPAHLRLAREVCRQSVAEFVKAWLMREDQWKNDHFSAIIVVFPDEENFSSDAALEQFQREPVLKLQPPHN